MQIDINPLRVIKLFDFLYWVDSINKCECLVTI